MKKTKMCSTCKRRLALSCFSQNASTKDGLSKICRECKKVYQRRYYRANRDAFCANTQARRDEIRGWFKEYKSTLKCSRCGEDHLACLQFHHCDPTEKIKDVSVMVYNSYAISKILDEIAKCIVLCANCHLKEHYG